MSSNSRKFAYEKQQAKSASETNTSTMAKVLSYDPVKGTMDVQPLSTRMVNGVPQQPPPILGVPVSGASGGGMQMSRQYKEGESVAISYMGQDMDNSMSKGSDNDPNTSRKNSGTDAVCMGGVMTGGATCKLPAGAEGFGSADGSMYIVFQDGKIKIKGDAEWEGNIEITGDLKVTGDVEVEGDVSTVGAFAIEGNLDVDGSITATGTITP